MAKYKGTIKFVTDSRTIALVEESEVLENLAITSTGLGTGDTSIVTFSGTLQPVMEEGSIVVKVAGVDQNFEEFSLETSAGQTMFTSSGMGVETTGGFMTSVGLVTSTGYAMLGSANLTTSSGAVNIINYEDGEILFSFGSAPGLGDKVTVSYERGYVSPYMTAIKLLKADFTNYTVGSTIYYDYTAGGEATEITLKRTGQE